MSTEPPASPAATGAPAVAPSRRPLIIGFGVGALSWLITLIPQRDYGQLVPLLFNCFALPVIAAVLAIIPRTRRFGLGLLLAAGGGWLILGAICGANR